MPPNPRIHIDVRRIATHGIRPGRVVIQRITKGVEIIPYVVALLETRLVIRARDISPLRINVVHCPTPSAELLFAGDRPIDAQDITASNVWNRRIFRFQLGNIDTVLVSLDFLLQYINAVVIRVANRPNRRIVLQEHFYETRSGSVLALVTSKLVRERIVEQGRLKIIRRVQDPIRFIRKAQQGNSFPVPKLVLDFHEKAAFCVSKRARTAQMGDSKFSQVWRICHRTASARNWFK